jgi:hypothetical protein
MRYRSLVRVTEPAVNPVTLSEAKAHLRIDANDEDTLISSLVTTATRWAEDYCDRTWVYTQWKMSVDSFYGNVGSPVQFGLKSDGNNIDGRQSVVPNLDLELQRPPMVQSGTATAITIAYTPTAEASTTTLDATQFRVDRLSTPGVCRPLYGQTWPSHLLDFNSTTVTYWAGYSADGTSVPGAAKSAILMIVAHLWKNREQTAEVALTEVPMGVKALLDTLRWGSYR